MWNKPTNEELANFPKLDGQNVKTTGDIIIYGHFFVGGCDWYVSEYSPEKRLFFGFACLGNEDFAEWGLIPFDELLSVKIGWVELDWEANWEPKKACEVELIKRCCL